VLIMKSDKHYWKITFGALMAHVSGLDKIRVQNQRMSEWKEVIFEGTYLELGKRENQNLADKLEFELVGTVTVENDTLVIGVNI
jgi:hypothetical protein